MHTSELPFPGCISLRQTGAAQDQWIVAKRHEEARQLTSIFYQFLIKRVLIERDGLLPNYRIMKGALHIEHVWFHSFLRASNLRHRLQ